MRKSLAFAAAFALFATTQAFAIAGLGAHYVYNMGATLKGGSEDVNLGGGTATLEREKASDLQGLGFKLWIDLLPVIDIEGTLNIAATRYKVYLKSIPGVAGDVPLTYKPEAPFSMVFGEASPVYGVMSGDLSITYPVEFDIIPLILKITPYAGAGVSYMAGIQLVDKSFAEKVIGKINDPANMNQKEVSEAFSKALTDASYTTGIGANILVGFRVKVAFLAVYANTKRYFGGNLHDKFSQGFVFELGGGLGF